MLLVNGRASYHSIGDELNLSSNAVKSRVMKMIDDGVIGRFVARVKLEAFGYDLIYVMISHGNEQEDTIMDRMKLVGNTFMVINCVGGVTVLGIAVKGELEQKMELVEKLVEPAMAINMFSVKAMPVRKVIQTDLMIIKHLVKYPRASINDIAKALKISTRTVKRRIDYLTKMEIIDFSVLYNPAAMRGFIQFSLLLDIDEKKYKEVVSRIYRELGDHFLLPPPPLYQKSMIVAILYCDNVFAMDEMFKAVRKMEGVKNVELSIPTTIDFKLDWFIMSIDKALKGREPVIMVK